jgi:hypothetical protein
VALELVGVLEASGLFASCPDTALQNVQVKSDGIVFEW